MKTLHGLGVLAQTRHEEGEQVGGDGVPKTSAEQTGEPAAGTHLRGGAGEGHDVCEGVGARHPVLWVPRTLCHGASVELKKASRT